jgi:hypothetical protein
VTGIAPSALAAEAAHAAVAPSGVVATRIAQGESRVLCARYTLADAALAQHLPVTLSFTWAPAEHAFVATIDYAVAAWVGAPLTGVKIALAPLPPEAIKRATPVSLPPKASFVAARSWFELEDIAPGAKGRIVLKVEPRDGVQLQPCAARLAFHVAAAARLPSGAGAEPADDPHPDLMAMPALVDGAATLTLKAGVYSAQ